MKTFFLRRILFFSIVLLAVACSSEEDVKPANETLLSSELFLSRTSGELQTFLGAAQINIDLSVLQYNVDIYKVTYNTIYKGQTIAASGLVILPQTTDEVGMLSFQHGTITANTEAPTQSPLSSTSLVLYAGIASPGFIAVVPDFIGFGNTQEIMHPYYVEDLTASAVIDNLKAARELAIEKGINFNSKLFLAGYSQGGYATMATHKQIESEGLPNFNLVASFPASGGYDVKAMQEYFFGLDTYENPYYIAYVAQAYKVTYDWSEPLSDFFQEPYATLIPGFFDGSKTSSAINSQLTNTIADLLTTDIRAGLDTDPKYEYLKDAFENNGLVSWKPTIKLFMYHGDADVTVPYENSVITYNKLISNGASTDVVKFTTLAGATHATGVIPYIEDFVPVMLDLK